MLDDARLNVLQLPGDVIEQEVEEACAEPPRMVH